MRSDNVTTTVHFELLSRRPEHGDFWVSLVGTVDAVLRAYHGIYEFTDDSDCVFRIALAPSEGPVVLADGTAIGECEPVGMLHLWNEHLRCYPIGGPDLEWASDMRRRVRYSLALLADYVERKPQWQPVRAFRGSANLSRRLGNRQIERVAHRFGFETIERPGTVLRQLHFYGDCLNTWALTRAFNPVALSRQRFLRGHCDLWITRATLFDRFARSSRRSVADKVSR